MRQRGQGWACLAMASALAGACTGEGEVARAAPLASRTGTTHPDGQTPAAVHNVAPRFRITAPVDGTVFTAGTPVTVTTAATDPGANTWVCLALDWGDGENLQGHGPGDGKGGCIGKHTFRRAGMYKLQWQLTDGTALVLSPPVMIVVVSPDAGIADGAGAIDAAAGATVAGVAGRAVFSFSARHDGGVAVGTVALDFEPGAFHFQSTAFDWFVLAPPYGERAGPLSFVAIKGQGRVVGMAAPCDFLMHGHDRDQPAAGGEDRFRLQVTCEGRVVFDNAPGPDDVDESDMQPIAAGDVLARPAAPWPLPADHADGAPGAALLR